MGMVCANGLEISGKSVSAKTIAAFPDVCFTPPQAPPTPPGVPIPYPSFGMAGDTEKGTGKVMIKDKTVNIKKKSDLSKTTGTEAGSAGKKGVVSSKNTGKEYFNCWSGNVKFESEPVVRMTDLATNNHGGPANAPPWAHFAGVDYSPVDCPSILAKVGLSVHEHGDANKNCNYKSRSDYDSTKPTQESDHFPQATTFTIGGRDAGGMTFPTGTYDIKKAPCVCLEDGKRLATEHGRKSEAQRWGTTKWLNKKASDPTWEPTYRDAKDADLEAMQYAKSPELNPDEDGNPHPALKCLELEMDKYFRDELGMDDTTPVATPNQKYTPKKFAARTAKIETRFKMKR